VQEGGFPGCTVDRLACIDVAALPLQLLLRRHSESRGEPAVVVGDHPKGCIEWVSDEARAVGVLSGQRYGAALAVAAGLRGGVISPTIDGPPGGDLSRPSRWKGLGVTPSRL